MNARSGNTISPLEVFDYGAAESRVRELTGQIIEEYVAIEIKRHAKECLQNFEPPTPHPLDNIEIREKFRSVARQEALKILEQEKKNVVDARTPHILLILKTYIKQLKYVLLDDEKPFKTCPEESWCPDYTGTSMEKIVTNYSRSQIIKRWDARLSEFSDFRPYLNPEVEALWKQADALASQESLLSKEELTRIEREASKTEKAEIQEASRAL